MITEQQYNRLSLLCQRGSMQSLRDIINVFQFDDFQTFSLAAAFILEKAVISLDTGLGKTLVAGGLINLDISGQRWLFVSKNNNLVQTAQKLNSIVNRDRVVQYTSGNIKNMMALIDNCQQNAVIVVTYETLNNLNFLNYLFNIRKTFSGIVIDESHNIGNKGSNRSEMLKHMLLNCFRYQYMLTATPLSINPFQICNQINMIDQELVPDPEQLAMQHTCYENGIVTGYHHLDDLHERISTRYISFTRAELGMKGNYKLKLWLCGVPEEFEVPKNTDELKAVKSYPNNDCVDRVLALVSKYQREGKRGLIYANLTLYKDMLKERLREICSVEILDGRVVGAADKRVIQQKFNDGQYSVLISNLEEGQDLPCDYIIFYELSVKYKQFIGRGERGLTGQDLDIHFVLVDRSYEIEFFYRNIYKRSLLLEMVCRKDVSEIKEIERQLKASLSEESQFDLEMLNNYMEE